MKWEDDGFSKRRDDRVKATNIYRIEENFSKEKIKKNISYIPLKVTWISSG